MKHRAARGSSLVRRIHAPRLAGLALGIVDDGSVAKVSP